MLGILVMDGKGNHIKKLKDRFCDLERKMQDTGVTRFLVNSVLSSHWRPYTPGPALWDLSPETSREAEEAARHILGVQQAGLRLSHLPAASLRVCVPLDAHGATAGQWSTWTWSAPGTLPLEALCPTTPSLLRPIPPQLQGAELSEVSGYKHPEEGAGRGAADGTTRTEGARVGRRRWQGEAGLVVSDSERFLRFPGAAPLRASVFSAYSVWRVTQVCHEH